MTSAVPGNAREFTATVSRGPGGRVVVAIPFDPSAVWGSKNRHYVTGTVAGTRIRVSVGVNGETFFLPLGEAWRRDSGIALGDVVSVVVWPEGPQQETLAEDIAHALTAEPRAREFFESLATFYRRNYVRWIEEAKRPQTRAARVSEMVDLLLAAKRQR